MQQFDQFEKILKNVVFEKDLSSLSLKNSSDRFSKLCRAFVIKFYNDNKDFNEAVSILNSIEDDLSLKLFDKFFNSDPQKITINHNRKNKYQTSRKNKTKPFLDPEDSISQKNPLEIPLTPNPTA